MAFPDDSLDLVVDAYLGGDWRDLSDRLMPESPVTIRRGTADGASQASAGLCRITLTDDDGALTPLNPLSPYYPAVRRGVRARVAVRRVRDQFGTTQSNGWGAGWAVDGGSSSNFGVAGGFGTIAHPSTNVLRSIVRSDVNLRNVDQVVSAKVSALVTGGSMVTGTLARQQANGDYYWLRVEFDHDSHDIVLKISKFLAVDGVIEDLAVLDPLPGLSYSAGTLIRYRTQVAGSRLAVKAWLASGPEPLDWQLTASDSDITEPGQVGVMTWAVAGNTNSPGLTVSCADYQALVLRAAGTTNSYRPRIVPVAGGDTVSAMTIELGGALRRLGRGTPPERSPMRRRFGAETDGLLAYWPLEDPPDSTQAASALSDVPAMTVAGSVGFGDGEVNTTTGGSRRYGTMPLANISAGGSLTGTVPLGTSSPVTWSVELFWQSVNATDDNMVLARWFTNGGTYLRWDLVQDVGGVDGTYLRGTTADGTTSTVWSAATTFAGPSELVVSAQQSGGNIAIAIRFDTYLSTASVAGTLGRITSVSLNPGRVSIASGDIFLVGHLRVWDAVAFPHEFVHLRADFGEYAVDRLARLTAEDGLVLDVADVDDAEQIAMGSQPDGIPAELYRECAEADGGVLFEPAEDIDLRHQPRGRRYNQTPSLVVDLSTYVTPKGTSDQVLAPVYDDQSLRNDVEVSRRDGSAARVVDEGSVAADGAIGDSVELNLGSDDMPLQIAAWLVHLGVVDEVRNPKMLIDLSGNPDLIDAWLSTDIGHRVQRTNVPPKRGGGVIDQLLDGYDETLGHRSWTVSANCSPAGPWDVAEVDGDQFVPADGTTLTGSGLAAGALTFNMLSTLENGPWFVGNAATAPDDFPQQLIIGGGEVVTATEITGTSPQTVTLSSRGDNGVTRAWPAGTSVDVLHPAIAPL